MKLANFAFVAVIAAALAAPNQLPAQAPNHHSQIHYRVVSLGVPLGGSASSTAAINSEGWIAGASNLSGDLDEHAVLWLYGFPLDLGTLGGPNSAVLWPGLNDFGQAVGVSDTAKPILMARAGAAAHFFRLRIRATPASGFSGSGA